MDLPASGGRARIRGTRLRLCPARVVDSTESFRASKNYTKESRERQSLRGGSGARRTGTRSRRCSIPCSSKHGRRRRSWWSTRAPVDRTAQIVRDIQRAASRSDPAAHARSGVSRNRSQRRRRGRGLRAYCVYRCRHSSWTATGWSVCARPSRRPRRARRRRMSSSAVTNPS